jgi:hypothetical protein
MNDKVSLLQLEQRHREAVWRDRPVFLVCPLWCFFVAAVIAPPFLISVTLFVPLFGLIVSLLALLLTTMVLRAQRSLPAALWYCGGLLVSLVICGLLGVTLGGRRDSVLYFVIGGGMFIALGYTVLAACALWRAGEVAECSVVCSSR